MGYVAATVETSPEHEQYIGAKSCGSGAAELSAKALAAVAVLAMRFTVPVIVRYDSITAASLAQSVANPTVHPELTVVAAVLWTVVQMRVAVVWQHVAPHNAEPFNELADALCWAAGSNIMACLLQHGD